MNRIASGPASTAPVAKAAVPWWVLPAIVLSGLAGALMARWIDASSPPAVPAAALQASPAASPPSLPALTVAAPLAVAAADLSLSGVLMVDGRPAMALVGVGRAPAVLLRVGDRLTATAVLASIEPDAIWVVDAAVRTRVPVSTPPAATARTMAAALPPQGSPAARGAEGSALAPTEAAGNGNAAFRAAVEDKLKTMNR